MLNCKQVTHLLSEAQDRELTLGERLPLRMHLAMCKGCRNFEKQLDFLRAALRGHPSRSEDQKPE